MNFQRSTLDTIFCEICRTKWVYCDPGKGNCVTFRSFYEKRQREVAKVKPAYQSKRTLIDSGCSEKYSQNLPINFDHNLHVITEITGDRAFAHLPYHRIKRHVMRCMPR